MKTNITDVSVSRVYIYHHCCVYMESRNTVPFEYYFQPYQGNGEGGKSEYWLNEIIPD